MQPISNERSEEPGNHHCVIFHKDKWLLKLVKNSRAPTLKSAWLKEGRVHEKYPCMGAGGGGVYCKPIAVLQYRGHTKKSGRAELSTLGYLQWDSSMFWLLAIQGSPKPKWFLPARRWGAPKCTNLFIWWGGYWLRKAKSQCIVNKEVGAV